MRFLKVTVFVEIAPAGLLQIGVSIHHGKVHLLTEFGEVWTFAPLERTHVGLLQTNDPDILDMSLRGLGADSMLRDDPICPVPQNRVGAAADS